MTGVGSSITNTRVTLANLVASAANIENVSMPTANNEYSHTFADGIKAFMIRTRNSGLLKLAFASGESATEYLTVFPGEPFQSIGLDGTEISIYFQSPSAGEVLEVVEWT